MDIWETGHEKRGQQVGDMVAVLINSISEKWNSNAGRVYCLETAGHPPLRGE